MQKVKCQEYPSLAVVLGENDTRISNRDAIEWINKIREYNTTQTECLCSIVQMSVTEPRIPSLNTPSDIATYYHRHTAIDGVG